MDQTGRIRALYDTTLKPRLDGLENLRRHVRTAIIKSAIIVGIPLLGVIGFGQIFTDNEAVPFISFAFVVAAVVFVAYRYAIPAFTAHTNYRTRFKRDVVTEIFRIVAPESQYDALKGMARQPLDGSGLLLDRGGHQSDDRVRGRIAGVPFEAAEVARRYTTRSSKSSTTHTVFHGLFLQLVADCPISGPVIVDPLSPGDAKLGDRSKLTEVLFDQPDFAREFKVHATNDADARRVMTPALQEGLLAVRRQTEHPVFLALHADRAFVAVNYGRELFEPTIASTTSVEAVEEIAAHFGVAELIVRELRLRPPAADATAEALFGADQPSDRSGLKERLSTGNLTESELLDAAFAMSGASYDTKNETPVARPAGSRVEIRSTGTAVTIAYGLPLSYFITVAVSVASGAVAAAALRAVGQTMNLGPLASVAGRIPEMPRVDAWVANVPLAWLIGGALIWAALTLWWLQRVRRVDIDTQAIRIYRGLRPFPRSYPRPPYGRIVRLDKCIYVGRTDVTSLVNPSASPVLKSDDEARWVAAEMKRALR